MKHNYKFLQLLLLFLMHFFVRGQGIPTSPCPLAFDHYNNPTNNSCVKLLEDFIPTPSDRVLTVNLQFWNFSMNDGSGRWHFNNITRAQHAVDRLNEIYSQIDTGYQALPGVPLIRDTKIRFRMANYYPFNATNAYMNMDHITNPYLINDCNAINVIYCHTSSSSVIQGASTPFYPGKFVFFPADKAETDPNFTVMDDDLDVSALAHEIGHALGLFHTVYGEGYTQAKSLMETTSCCEYLVADDVSLENSTWGTGDDCAPYATVNGHYSNNIMSNNGKCRHYLTPKQMGIIHYTLRTVMKDVLTSSSQTAALTVDHHFDKTISGSELWTTDRYMKGDVIVEPAAILNIACNVAMAAHARIIVKPKGQLIISGKVTNISGELWGGIQVGGADTLDQSIGSGGFGNHQGIVYLTSSNSRLSNAENAIKNYLTDTLGGVTWGSSGGIVLATQTNFINNNRDVEFYPHRNGQSASYFTSCNFKTTGAINTLTGTASGPMIRVSLWGIEGVKFRGCNFIYGAGNTYLDHGTGILSYDASYSVDKAGNTPTIFDKQQYGAYAIAANPLRLPAINNSDFYDNTKDGAYFQNLTSVAFNNNYMRIPGVAFTDGLYLNSCKQYNVTNNTFMEASDQARYATGIRAYNAMAGAHRLYRNNISNLYMGISAIGNNSGVANTANGLKMNCEDFSAAANRYDVVMSSSGTAPTVMKDQGVASFDGSQLVRNIYGANFPCSGCEEQWYIEGTSVRKINHPSNAQAFTQPIPQPGRSDDSVIVVSMPIPFNYTVHCAPGQLSSGNSGTAVPTPLEQLANVNDYLTLLLADNGDDRHHFEIEASLTVKLNLFLTDSTLQNKDSVIALLEGNAARIADADLLTVYAYMNKGDLARAQAKADALGEGRAVWTQVLTKLIGYQAHPQSLYNLSRTDSSFWEQRAAQEDNDGFAAAQAVLKMAVKRSFDDPRPEPEGGKDTPGERHAQPGTGQQADPLPMEIAQAKLSLYPNPAQEVVLLSYDNPVNTPLRVQMADALGRLVYQGSVKPGERLSIPLTGFGSGMYQLNAYSSKTMVFYTKVICIK